MYEEEHYSAMDADHDGTVSHEEFEAFRQQRMEQRARERAELDQQRMEKRKEMDEKYEGLSHDQGTQGDSN